MLLAWLLETWINDGNDPSCTSQIMLVEGKYIYIYVARRLRAVAPIKSCYPLSNVET